MKSPKQCYVVWRKYVYVAKYSPPTPRGVEWDKLLSLQKKPRMNMTSIFPWMNEWIFVVAEFFKNINFFAINPLPKVFYSACALYNMTAQLKY